MCWQCNIFFISRLREPLSVTRVRSRMKRRHLDNSDICHAPSLACHNLPPVCVYKTEKWFFSFFFFFYIHYTASQTSGRLSYVMLESEIHNIARGKGLGIWEKYVLVAVPASELFFFMRTTRTPTLNKKSRFHNSTLDFPSTPLANRRINVSWKPRISRPNRSGTNIPFTDSLKKIYDLPKPRRGLKPTAYTFP